jgi:hypothetical protein
VKRIAGFLALILAALICASLATAFPANGAPAADQTAKTAVDDFGACLAGQQQGDLLLVIDESGSLAQSDPAAARVTAANYLVDRLSSFAGSEGVSVDIAVAGFAESFTPTLPWASVSSSSIGAIHAAVDGFAGKRAGNDTDYWTALDGARTYLAERGSGPEGVPRCQAMAWFTDGQLDFTARDGLEKPFAPGLVMNTQGASRRRRRRFVGQEGSPTRSDLRAS